jgi:hypothetical protein
MIPLSNHDFQGSGELWGRDEINPDTWILWVINHPAFTDPCRVHPPQKNRPQLRAARIPRSGRALPGPHSKPCSKVPEDERSWNRGISHMNAGDEHVCILYVYIYIYICMYVCIYIFLDTPGFNCFLHWIFDLFTSTGLAMFSRWFPGSQEFIHLPVPASGGYPVVV